MYLSLSTCITALLWPALTYTIAGLDWTGLSPIKDETEEDNSMRTGITGCLHFSSLTRFHLRGIKVGYQQV